jgi:hypothetical protein
MTWLNRRNIGRAVGVTLLTFAGIQWIPGPERTNPPVRQDQRVEARIEVPEHISSILNRACRDCHSNETRWPWYSRLAPARWAVAADVQKARRAVNFSEWAGNNGRTPGVAIATLAAACANVQGRRMPMPRYTALHREARLTEGDIQAFCAWTQTETRRIARQQREQRQLASRPVPASSNN